MTTYSTRHTKDIAMNQPERSDDPTVPATDALIAESYLALQDDNPCQAYVMAAEAYRVAGLHTTDSLVPLHAAVLATMAARQAGLGQRAINCWESRTAQALPASEYRDIPVEITLRAMGVPIATAPPTA